MGQGTKIEWTDTTWNPIRARRKDTGKIGWHCERISPGCQNCYAERMNGRTNGLVGIGTGLPYTVPAREQVELYLDEETLMEPLRWRKPRMVFPCSMTDMYADFVPDEWIERIFTVMALCPGHTFQVLTKRADRMQRYLTNPDLQDRITDIWAGDEPDKQTWSIMLPLPNVWLGVSAENQEYADKRIPHLLRTPAAIRWVSAEPLLGPLDLSRYLSDIDWVVVGGESGPGARPCNIEWVRSIVRQCQDANVPVFVKQLGARPYGVSTPWATQRVWPHSPQYFDHSTGEYRAYTRLRDRKGGDIAEWPEDLRVRQTPQEGRR